VYQSELTYRLAQMGYELEPGRSGAPEIKGYSQEYLDASSPRSQQIRAHLERLGLTSKESAEIAAHSTRDRKQILTPQEVLNAHKKLAAEFGNQAEHVVAEARARERRREHGSPAISALRAQEAVIFSRDKHFEREAVVDERLLMRDALRRGMGKTTYHEVHQNFQTRVEKGEFLAVNPAADPTRRLFTTPETVAAERAVIQHMLAGQGRVEPMLSPREAAAAAVQRSDLNSAQTAALEHVLSSRDRILGIQGSAGTGKTTALEVIRRAAEAKTYEVEGFAPTSRAAKQLREAGIPAGTLQAFLARGRDRDAPREKHLYMVDESSLASTTQMKDFMARLGTEDRVVLIGDIRQHQAVEAGKPFEQLQEAGMSTAKLERIVRQTDPDLKAVVEQFAQGQVSSGVQALAKQGRITEIGDAVERLGTESVKPQVLLKGVGGITENDVLLASASNAIIIGFNVRPEPKAAALAEREGVDIRAYNVIYEALDDIRAAMEGLLEPTLKERILGRAEVRQVFMIPKVGAVAGCYVTDGTIARASSGIRVVRDGVVVYEGKIGSLRRFKDDVKEVQTGYECGISVENFNDLKPGDRLEVYTLDKIATKL